MKNQLLVECFTQNKKIKTWRLDSKHPWYTVGRSQHADLRLPDLAGLQWAIDFHDGQWQISDIAGESLEVSGQSLSCHIVANETEFVFGKYRIVLKPFQADKALFSDQSQVESTKCVQALIVRFQGHIVETDFKKSGQSFSFHFEKKKIVIAPLSQSEPKFFTVGPYEMEQRWVSDTSKSYFHWNRWDKKALSTVLLSFGFTSMTLLTSWVVVSNKPEPVAPLAVRILQPKEFVKEEKKPKMQKPSQSQASAPKKPSPNPPPVVAKAPAAEKTKTASKAPQQTSQTPKTLSRLSQLVGKVAKRVSKNSKLIATKGVSANKAQSGTALAAIGTSLSGGGQVKNLLDGQKFKGVGTAGKAGGSNNIAGYGGIGSSGVGLGGVGILEDETEVIGGLERDVIARYIKNHLGQILYCYERQLSAQPDLYGKVHIQFEIKANGRVQSQRIHETTLQNRRVENCILQRVAKWNFPKPKGGTRVVVTYPFLFKSTN